MAYELFTPKATRIWSPALTIKRDGRITFNSDAGDLLRDAGAKFVQILWDSDTRRVAFRPQSKASEGSYKLTVSGSKRGAAISGLAFLRYIGWDLSHTVTIPVEWKTEVEALEAPLPNVNFARSPESAST
jgi:hypothetical protein